MVISSHGEQFEPKEKAVTAWVMAVLAAAAAAFVGWLLGWPWILDMDHPDFNPMILLVGILLALCLWNLIQGLRWTRRARTHGASLIDIDGRPPIPLGSVFSGRVRTSQAIRAQGDFRLVLTCFDVHERRHAGTTSGSPHRNEAFSVWTASQTLPATTDSARGIPFRFDLPASVGDKPVPAIRSRPNPYFSGSISINIPGLRRIFTRNQPPVSRYWTLVVTAATEGPDYRAEFTVPLAEY